MRLLILSAFLAATAAQAQTKLIGFVTVDGRHPAPTCQSADQRVGTLVLTNGESELEVPLTCEAAPAVAFSVVVPEGTWQVKVTGEQLDMRAKKLTVAGPRQLVTFAGRRSAQPPRPAVALAARAGGTARAATSHGL